MTEHERCLRELWAEIDAALVWIDEVAYRNRITAPGAWCLRVMLRRLEHNIRFYRRQWYMRRYR